jgi:hypothetical protein
LSSRARIVTPPDEVASRGDRPDVAQLRVPRGDDPFLAALGAQAERNFADDPNTTLLKLRQLAEHWNAIVNNGGQESA